MITANVSEEIISKNIHEEIQAFKDLANDFAGKELLDQKEENDRYPFAKLFTGSIKNAGEVGFYGVNLPAEYDGIAMGISTLAVILENISKVDASMAGVIFTNAAALQILMEGARDADCSRIYKKLAEPDSMPVAFQSNTSPAEIELPIVIDKDNSVISGKLDYLVLGGISKYAVILAKNIEDKEFSYYLVDMNHQGITKSETVLSLGLHACPAVDVAMNNVPAMLIGKKKEGEKYFKKMQSQLSVAAASMSVGLMKGSFEEALQYTRDRYQGGRQIIDWSEVRMILANFAIELKVGISCLADACLELETLTPGWEKTARATAIHLGELSCRATADGIQLMGGNGYMKDYGQEKRLRDAKQVQALLGMAPIRKMDYIDEIIKEGE